MFRGPSFQIPAYLLIIAAIDHFALPQYAGHELEMAVGALISVAAFRAVEAFAVRREHP